MNKMYDLVKEKYATLGLDTEKAMETLSSIPVSVHCWQGDDVVGFDGGGAASGGIQTTGNYPGRARTPEELMADIKTAFALMPGKKRLNLHASYAILGEDMGKVDRNTYEPKHFAPWVKFAKENGFDGIDFNPTMFSHKNVKDGLTLSSPDENIRKFWVEHCKACIRISEYFAEEFNTVCAMNIWIPDGYKDVPADRLSPRLRLKKSLDEILSIEYNRSKVAVAVESKVFGIGVESYTVGSNEFYQNYAAKNDICCLLDNGHYHPTEVVSDKIPALLAFYDKLALHVTRGVRWDSDHVVLLEDEIKEIAKEIVRCDAVDKVMIGLDYFDASINRLSAWVTGQRAMQQALLCALLTPHEELKALQEAGNFTALMVRQEQLKTLPWGIVWEEYLERQGLNVNYLETIRTYEEKILKERV
ncbi:MAG: L-rhamnose isomerase [Clostridia bacterium]|nr:L-rhamnose isomerase [Clostridia bacterium]